jgi:CRISPR-associated protein Cas2
MRTVICFDISEDRRRYRAVQALLARAARVQKSVFESDNLGRASFLRLRSRLEGIIDPKTDSLRYYPLCRACVERVEAFGKGPGILKDPPEVDVI